MNVYVFTYTFRLFCTHYSIQYMLYCVDSMPTLTNPCTSHHMGDSNGATACCNFWTGECVIFISDNPPYWKRHTLDGMKWNLTGRSQMERSGYFSSLENGDLDHRSFNQSVIRWTTNLPHLSIIFFVLFIEEFNMKKEMFPAVCNNSKFIDWDNIR